jgi:hypothetical protein
LLLGANPANGILAVSNQPIIGFSEMAAARIGLFARTLLI